MCSFYDFLQEFMNSTNIPFCIQYENGIQIVNTLPKRIENIVEESINLGERQGKIITTREFENCISIIRYFVEGKIKELYVNREQTLIDMLQGNEVSQEIIKNNTPFLLNKAFIINIFLEGNIEDGLELVKESYKENETIITLYKNNIVMVADLDEIEEHVSGIKDSITANLYRECYMSYREIDNVKNIKESFEINKKNIVLGMKYDLSQKIYNEKNLLFESIIDSVEDTVKEKIFDKFSDGFSKLDSEMIKTIEEFFKCGLNISDASKKLYVHRNTLIYRLDKIEKLTGYDIRTFNEAVIFKIAFLMWKEKSKNITN